MNTQHDRYIPADEDQALKDALISLPAPLDAARVEALQQRVISQWHDSRYAETADAGPVAAVAGWKTRRTWLAGATGLALGLALLVGGWLRPVDPALDELLQPDVLSQMAAGEM